MVTGVRTQVACFGEALWDMMELPGRSPTAVRYERVLGGAPANVATGLSRLGVRASLIAGLGRDSFGEALAAHLERDGVDVRHLVWMDRRTGVTFVSRDARGQPSFLFYRHETADVSLTEAHISKDMARVRWGLLGSSTMMTSDLRAATMQFVTHVESNKANLFFDLNVRAHLWRSKEKMRDAVSELATRAAVIKASSDDLAALGSEAKALAFLRTRAPRAIVIVTRGAQSMTAIGPFGEVTMSAKRSRCVDATGAGDAFIAGTLAVLIAQRACPGTLVWSDPRLWSRVLDVGRRMGQKAVSRAGAVTGLVRLDSIRNFASTPLS